MRKFFKSSIVLVFIILLLVGCSSKNETQKPTVKDNSNIKTTEVKIEEENIKLKGHSLLIFCGAGMKDPFEKISQQFQKATGCDVQVTYGNAGQTQTQIKTAKEGDFFIAGSKEELKPVEKLVLSSKDLVLHIPVIAVGSGNPKGINGPSDLAKQGVKFIMGDPQATPIGKIANKVISDFKLKDKINIIANTATAPAMIIALESDEADAAIVWKENVKGNKLQIVDSKDMSAYIKTIPAAMLNCTKDKETQKAFSDYLNTQEVKAIWNEFGYKIVE
ncbi:molybdate ABC transporter substrate-binding protein [Clostridium sp.]|uniref:molybdate ABC transporter substrate-binding protein n=1 Tax=Clostridium sp. TaxID=1506 RepID=UPI003D6D2160